MTYNRAVITVVLKQHGLDLFTKDTIIQQLIKEEYNEDLTLEEINNEIGILFELNSDLNNIPEIEEDLINEIIFNENDRK